MAIRTHPLIVAHRGARHEYPENTLPAISAALGIAGVGATEFDVELTRDKKLVVVHQETVVPNNEFKRLEFAERNYTSRDWVGQYLEKEVLTLDAGSCLGDKFASIRIPSLRDVLALPWHAQTACIELKDATFWSKNPDPNRAAEVISALLPEIKDFSGSLNILSFNPQFLRELKKYRPQTSMTLALWTEWQNSQDDAFALAKGVGAETITIADTMVLSKPDWVALAHGAGLKIHVYPVSPSHDEPEFEDWTPRSQYDKWRRLIELGIDGLVTDFPRETVAFLSQRA